jgi:hypothetical protein
MAVRLAAGAGLVPGRVVVLLPDARLSYGSGIGEKV